MKLVLPKCDKCRKTMPPEKAMRLIWKDKGVMVDLCPKCYHAIYTRALRTVTIKKKILDGLGYFDPSMKGVKEVDIKRYLYKWATKLKNQVDQ